MAGDWIKMRHSLVRDGRVVAVARAVRAGIASASLRHRFGIASASVERCNGIGPASLEHLSGIADGDSAPMPESAIDDATARRDRLMVVGALHALWSLADEQTTGGWLVGWDAEAIDAEIGLPGFSRALEAVGWLEISAEGVQVPKFQEHMDSSAKARAQANRRSAAAKAKLSAPAKEQPASAQHRSSIAPASVEHRSGIGASDAKAMPEKRREEKRREEKNTRNPPTPFCVDRTIESEAPDVGAAVELPHPDGSAGSQTFEPEVYDEPGEWIEPADPWDPFCRRWHRWRAVEPPQDRQTAAVVEWIAHRSGPQGLSRPHWIWWLRSLPTLPPEEIGVEPDAVLDWLRKIGSLPLPPLPPPEDPAYDAALRSLPCAPVNPEAGTTSEAVRVFERYSEAVGNDAERAKGIMRIVGLIGGSICGSVDPETLIRAAENYGRELPNDREAGRRKTAASFYGDPEMLWKVLGDPSYEPKRPRMADSRRRKKE